MIMSWLAVLKKNLHIVCPFVCYTIQWTSKFSSGYLGSNWVYYSIFRVFWQRNWEVISALKIALKENSMSQYNSKELRGIMKELLPITFLPFQIKQNV